VRLPWTRSEEQKMEERRETDAALNKLSLTILELNETLKEVRDVTQKVVNGRHKRSAEQ
jgi:hypothetical protein